MCKNKDYFGIVLPSENYNIVQFNQYMNSDKIPYIIYANTESLIKKIDGCLSNPENNSTIPCGYSMSTIWAFHSIEEKHTLCCGEDCMKSFANL